MNDTTETISDAADTRRLSRSRDGRWLGGVAAGLGSYFRMDPLIYRIGFLALSLAGGTGILLYVAAWLVMPEEGTEDSIADSAIKRHRDRPGLLVGVGLLGLAAILTLSSSHVWPGPANLWVAAALAGAAIVWWQAGNRGVPRAAAPGEPVTVAPRRRPLGAVTAAALITGLGLVALVDSATGANIDWRIVLAVAAVILGGLVAAGAATGHSVGSVIVLGLGVLAVLAVAIAVRVPIFAGVGDRVAHPVAFASISQRYEHGIGNLEIDLQDVAFPVGKTHVKATLGIGDLLVRVPENVTLVVDGHAGAGKVTLLGQTDDGRSVHDRLTDPGAQGPARIVVLEARVGLGELEVQRG